MAGKKIILVLISFCIVVSLLNGKYFGAGSLTSYFLYTIIAVVIANTIFIIALIKTPVVVIKIPFHCLLFSLLSFFMFLQGVVSHSFTLSHYYWFVNAFLLLSLTIWTQQLNTLPGTLKKTKITLYAAVIWIMFIESIIVILQYAGVLKSNNQFFSCTGTWQNPNVSALFIAFGIYSIIQVSRNKVNSFFYKKNILNIVLAISLLAVLLLQCRSAYIIALFFILFHYSGYLKGLLPKTVQLKKWPLFFTGLFVVGICSFLLAFNYKTNSTGGRIQVLRNSIELIANEPVTGYGIDMFEKKYNLFIAEKNAANNEHVNMAYNDFVELAVELGIGGVLLWIFFIVAVYFFCIRNGYSILPISALVIMQSTNFGFQAIPAFALCIIYIAVGSIRNGEVDPSSYHIVSFNKKVSRFILIITTLAGCALLVAQIKRSRSFYLQNIAATQLLPQQAIATYKKLSSSLNDFFGFHEHYGDAYKKIQDYTAAKEQYLSALKKCSKPDIIFKTAYCYQQMQNYDSSHYYYTLGQYMEPGKVGPRIALLQLYMQLKDTFNIKKKAKEIINMPLKIQNQKGENMKRYAQKILDQMNKTNGQ